MPVDMVVTINTDASYHSGFKIGTYAFLIVCNEGRISHSGVLRKQVSRPEQAEFKCILNAFHVLANQKFSRISKIIVNTDCLNVIHLVNNNKQAIEKYRLASWGKDLIIRYDIQIYKMKLKKSQVEFRHVPAHDNTNTKRTWVNDQLDKQAKEMLWKEINSKQ